MQVPMSDFRLETEAPVQDAFDIFQMIRYKVVSCNESWDILCTGPKGVGKSSTMLRLAMLVDPYFSLNRWAFTTDDLMEMRNKARIGNAIVSDEMGTQDALSSQNWMSKSSKEAVDVHQLDRTERIINIGTTLDIGRINNRVRTQYKVIVNIEGKMDDTETNRHGLGTKCLIRFIEEDPFAMNDSDAFKKKYFRDHNGRRISRVIIPHPPAAMFRKYSTMRDEFKRKLKEKPDTQKGTKKQQIENEAYEKEMAKLGISTR